MKRPCPYCGGKKKRWETRRVCPLCGLVFKGEGGGGGDGAISQESRARIARLNAASREKRAGRRKTARTSTPRARFFHGVAWVALLSFIPVINQPFQALHIFFHEMSHGLAALLVSGRIQAIIVTHQEGLILTSGTGGLHGLVSWAGYAGTVFWGAMLYRCGLRATPRGAFLFICGVVLLLGVSTVFWIRDDQSVSTLLTVYLIFSCSLYLLQKPQWARKLNGFLKFSGLYVAVQSVIDPLFLLQGKNLGDAGSLASTGLPDLFWIGQWAVIALLGLAGIWSMETNVGIRLRTTAPRREGKGALVPARAVV